MEEMDWIAGRVLESLKHFGAKNNALVVFTSDNGPWTAEQSCSRSKGPFLGQWLADHGDPTCVACPSEYTPAPSTERPLRCIYDEDYEIDGVPYGHDTGLGSAWEANVLMPAFVKWPDGGIQGGTKTRVTTLDVLPTVLGLLGIPLSNQSKVDGIDASDVFLGTSITQKRDDRVIFFWRDGFTHGPLPQPFGRFDVVAINCRTVPAAVFAEE